MNESELITCSHCNCEYKQSAVHYYNDDELALCESCRAQYQKCEQCGILVLTADMSDSSIGDICQNCAYDMTSCEHCGILLLDDDTHTCQDTVFCESCYNDNTSECNNCGNRYLDDDMYFHRDALFCESCYNEIFTTCESCGITIYTNDSFEDSDNCTVCEDCHEETTSIRNHEYTPQLQFYPEKSNLLFLGLEYEVYNDIHTDNNNNTAGAVIDTFDNFFYCKADSSIDDGFEIVSHPATLEFHHKAGYEKLIALLKNNGFSSNSKYGNCGIHVHIDRTWIEKNLGRFASVKYGMFIRNIQRYAEKLGRRSNSTWARFDCIEKSYYKELANQGNKPFYHAKYSAVNYQHNDTIETRIFAGTSRAYRLLSALEFCHAVINHVDTIGYTYIESKHDYTLWNNFANFVKQNCRLYVNLLKTMYEFNIMEA